MSKEEIEEEKEKPNPDYTVEVEKALVSRGIKLSSYDEIKVIYLWGDGPRHRIRVNCFKKNKIPDSFFLLFSEAEGILRSWPAIGEYNADLTKVQ